MAKVNHYKVDIETNMAAIARRNNKISGIKSISSKKDGSGLIRVITVRYTDGSDLTLRYCESGEVLRGIKEFDNVAYLYDSPDPFIISTVKEEFRPTGKTILYSGPNSPGYCRKTMQETYNEIVGWYRLEQQQKQYEEEEG